jgi:hypothetical protein
VWSDPGDDRLDDGPDVELSSRPPPLGGRVRQLYQSRVTTVWGAPPQRAVTRNALALGQVTVRIINMRRKSFSDQLRDAVNASGMSRYAICNAIGLNQSNMSRFMNKKGGLSMTVLDGLADLLGLDVVTRAKTKKGRG